MYSAKELYTPKSSFGQRTIGVFFKDEKIGEYIRNYSLMETFYPFEQDGKWYALYSKDYTATRIMSLPDCKDICGEEPDPSGFCPVEYYVPLSYGRDINPDDPEPVLDPHEPDKSIAKYISWSNRNPFIEKHARFGFVAGCVWGDDSSWKVMFVDLSEINVGKLPIYDKFGYIELPQNLALKDAIICDVSSHIDADPSDQRIYIATPSCFDLNGKKLTYE